MTGGYAGDSSDDCTATKNQVLEGYKAITKDSDDDAELGTMPNKGAWTNRIGVNGKAIIPAGYHNGSGYVDQAITNRGAWGTSIGINGNITIPEGYHNGLGHVTQSIATMGGQTITPSANQQTVACSGKYMTGNITIQPCVQEYAYQYNITVRKLSCDLSGQSSFNVVFPFNYDYKTQSIAMCAFCCKRGANAKYSTMHGIIDNAVSGSVSSIAVHASGTSADMWNDYCAFAASSGKLTCKYLRLDKMISQYNISIPSEEYCINFKFNIFAKKLVLT